MNNCKKVPHCDRYNEELYSLPLWDSDIVYNETLMLVRDADGKVPPAPLLYKPDEIFSVRSFDLSVEYAENVDYTVENGCIVPTDDSRMYIWQHDEYYPPNSVPDKSFSREGGGFIAYGEADTFFKTQLAVCYRHSDKWTGPVPQSCHERLPVTVKKLSGNENLTVVFYGDSITTGVNSSMTQAPYAPMWTQMVTARLGAQYNNEHITNINTAVGGTASKWALENAAERVCAYSPDLVILAFGANDIATPTERFADNMRGIISLVRETNPAAEFILVSPWQTNREVHGFFGNQSTFENALLELTKEFSGTALAPVYSVHSHILTKKRYYDMSGNNVNHPNDFAARMYSQTVSALLL